MANLGGYLQEMPAWFDPEKYEGFNWVDGQSHQELIKVWSKALWLRQTIPSLNASLKAVCIEKLIQNPLDDCDFGIEFNYKNDSNYPDNRHPYGQATLTPTKYGDVPNPLERDLDLLNPSLYLDDLYNYECPNAHPKAFLTVNLAASDSHIKNDFNHWLQAVRNHRKWPRSFSKTPEALVSKWSSYKLIACIDLIKIIGPAKGVRISSRKATEWAQVSRGILRENFIASTLSKTMDLALEAKTAQYLA